MTNTDQIIAEALLPILEATLAADPSPHVVDVTVRVEKKNGENVLTYTAWAHSVRHEANSAEGLIEVVEGYDANKAAIERNRLRIEALKTEIAGLEKANIKA